MRIELNTDVEDIEVSELTPLEPGEYELVVAEEPEHREGPNSDYLRWRFEVVNHPDEEGHPVWHNTFLSKKSVEAGMPDGIVALLQATDTPYEIVNGNTVFDTTDVVGQHILAEVGQRTNDSDENDDNIYNEVNKIYPVFE